MDSVYLFPILKAMMLEMMGACRTPVLGCGLFSGAKPRKLSFSFLER